jgi:hypothetical protein
MINSYRDLFGKPEAKTLTIRPGHRCENNIKMDHTEIGQEGVNWVHLAPDRDQW